MRIGDIMQLRTINSNVDFSKVPLDKFQETLEGLDWYYGYSDDHRVFESGARCFANLFNFMESASSEFRQIYNLVHYNMYDKGLCDQDKYETVFADDGFPE
jgi:hypothetical protein